MRMDIVVEWGEERCIVFEALIDQQGGYVRTKLTSKEKDVPQEAIRRAEDQLIMMLAYKFPPELTQEPLPENYV